ncbi:flagellar biosynthesis, cell-distal portion of basal-body rod [Klebsiella quasipneumoniae]|nr:flagellar biosynthesis, cell-distal portion of basal-body rod [Klebsiella quasipneumoniae]
MAFDPPLGSTSPAVLLDNATRLDELVNGPAGTVTDRAGQPLDSWRLMLQTFAAIVENTRENLIPLGKQYTDLSKAQADIANIPDGAVIYVLSPLSDVLACHGRAGHRSQDQVPDLCGRLHEGVSDNYHRIRDFRRSGHAYSGQHCTVSRLSGDDKN